MGGNTAEAWRQVVPGQCASLETSLHLRSVHLSPHIPLWPVSSSHWGMWVLDHLKDPQLMMPLTNKKLKFWDGTFLKEWMGLCGSLCHWPQCFTSPESFRLLLTVELSQETDHTSHFLTVSGWELAVCWFLVWSAGSLFCFLSALALWLFPKDMPRPALRSLETHGAQSPSLHLLTLWTQLHEPAQPRSHLTHLSEPSLYQLIFVWPQLRGEHMIVVLRHEIVYPAFSWQ